MKVIITLLSLAGVLLFVTACDNIFWQHDASGQGVVRVNLLPRGAALQSAARTVFPSMEQFDEVEYAFATMPGGGEAEVTDLGGGEFMLPAGSYTVTVQGYMGEGESRQLAATGTSEQFTVTEGGGIDVGVALAAAETSGQGTFEYTLVYPSDVWATVRLQKLGDTSTIWMNPAVTADGEIRTARETRTLDAGTYRLSIELSRGGETSGVSESIHIVPLMTTSYVPEPFTSATMIPSTVTFSGIWLTPPSLNADPATEIRITIFTGEEIYDLHSQYTGTVTWEPNHETFQGGTAYTATVTLTPGLGWTLQGVEADFFTLHNSWDIEGEEINLTNAVDSGVITVAFPQLPEARHGISLSQTETFTFPSLVVGYDGEEVMGIGPWVTIANTGNVPTGELEFTLSGTNAGSFNARFENWWGEGNPNLQHEGSEVHLTIEPVVGLAVGTYTATVTVGNDIVGRHSFDVSLTVEEPVFGISLSQTADYAFPSAEPGYATPPPALSVALSNTGNMPTGLLTIELSGDGKDSFSIPNVWWMNSGSGVWPSWGEVTFTVRPIAGLAEGIHTATVTVGNDNVGTHSFNVSFAVNAAGPVYGISLSETGTYDLGTAAPGYNEWDFRRNITVTNTGNVSTGHLTVALTGENAGSFSLHTSLSSIAVGGTDTFGVWPNNGLAVGIYTATVTVSNDNVEAQSFNVSFTVDTSGFSISLTNNGNPLTGTYNLGTVVPGYNAWNTGIFVTVTNTGIHPTGNLTMSLSGENAGSFSMPYGIGTTSLVAGETFNLKVDPLANLSAGTYTATVTVSNANVSASFDVSFTVVDPVGSGQIAYYWIDAHGRLVTNADNITINRRENLAITASSEMLAQGYTVLRWVVNGVTQDGETGTTFNFSRPVPGKYNVGLFVSKDGNQYNTNITVTVQ